MNSETKIEQQGIFLVTGGAGFIGHRVVEFLAKSEHHVISVDDYSFGRETHDVLTNVTSIRCDIRNREEITSIIQKYQPHCIVHLAALHHIPTCEKRPEDAIAINIAGTENVLRALPGGNVVLASSGAVYDWQDAPLTESSDVLPHDLYALCKFANEHQLRIWREQTGGHYVVARIFNTIGHDDTNGHLIPDILKQIGNGNDTVKLGNLQPKRDYIHADDTAAAISALAIKIGSLPAGSVYNVSTGSEHSVVDLVNAVGEALQRNLVIEQDPARIRKVDRLHQLGVNERLKNAVDWEPQINFKAALKNIIENS